MFRVFEPKSRLPKTMSYVVGTQLLSERFAHVPQAAEIEIDYCNRPLGHPFTLHDIVSKELPYPVLSARYFRFSAASAAVSRKHPFGPKWYLYVYPVERKRRHEVRKLLIEKAFPFMDKWLCAERPDTWYDSGKRLDCVFFPKTGHLEVRERSD
jgi:hypothetical protein